MWRGGLRGRWRVLGAWRGGAPVGKLLHEAVDLLRLARQLEEREEEAQRLAQEAQGLTQAEPTARASSAALLSSSSAESSNVF